MGPIFTDMDSAGLIESLTNAGVLAVADNEMLCRAALFDKREAELQNAPEECADSLNDAIVSALTRNSLLATYLAVSDLAELDEADALRAVLLLARLGRVEPPDDGAPEAFTAVDGDLLDLVLLLTERAIVYVWRHECPPCDVMREEFDDIFSTPPLDVALLAVFGPDWPVHLQEQYNVVGGPTALFMIGKRVEVRLQGGQHCSVIENEVSKFLTAAN
jgi:hypothetical protein